MNISISFKFLPSLYQVHSIDIGIEEVVTPDSGKQIH